MTKWEIGLTYTSPEKITRVTAISENAAWASHETEVSIHAPYPDSLALTVKKLEAQ